MPFISTIFLSFNCFRYCSGVLINLFLYFFISAANQSNSFPVNATNSLTTLPLYSFPMVSIPWTNSTLSKKISFVKIIYVVIYKSYRIRFICMQVVAKICNVILKGDMLFYRPKKVCFPIFVMYDSCKITI